MLFILKNIEQQQFSEDNPVPVENLFKTNDEVDLTSSDNSIKVENNDLKVNVEGWDLAADLDALTPNITVD